MIAAPQICHTYEDKIVIGGSREIRLANEALFLAPDDSDLVIGIERVVEDGNAPI
jgi:hypothetical protein